MTPGQGPERAVHLDAQAFGDGSIHQAGRDQHIHYTDGIYDQRRAAPGQLVPECPYPGLAAFEPAQARWFFGRDRLIAELTTRLDRRLLTGGMQMVVAPSGAGKSSLLRAGLLPALDRAALPGSDRWPKLVITPTVNPLWALAAGIAPLVGTEVAEVVNELVADPARCLWRLSHAPHGRCVVVVDQLEQLFTLCADDQQRGTFIDVLTWIASTRPAYGPGDEPVGLVVLGVRADFYAACVEHAPLRAALEDAPLVVGPMSEPELREAILFPARQVGLDIEPGLVEVLLRDLGATAGGNGAYEAGRLPLLAHALRASWQQRHGWTMTVAGYRATGGIHWAVATTAEWLFARLRPPAQDAARGVFLRLVTLGGEGNHIEDTRRRVARADLLRVAVDPVAVAAVLDTFTQGRLLTQENDTVEITHEALLRAWPRLRGWLDTDRAGSRTAQELEDTALVWDRNRADSAILFRGSRLESARTWAGTRAAGALSAVGSAFLAASIWHQRRAAGLRRAAVLALVILVVAASTLAIVARQQQNAAVTAGQEAASQRDIAASGELIGESENPVTGPRTARLEGLAAWELDPSAEARYAMMAAASRPELASFLLTSDNSDVTSATLSPDGKIIAIATTVGFVGGIGGTGGGVELWDLNKGQQIGKTLDSSTGARSVVFSPDGKTLATADNVGAQLWNVGTGQQIGNIANDAGVTDSVAFSPDGKTLATGTETSYGDGGAQLWDVTTGEQIGTTVDGSSSVKSVAFSPDGRTLATGTASGADLGGGVGGAQLWSLRTDQQLGSTVDGSSSVDSVAFSPDGKTLATGTASGTGTGGGTGGAQLWDVGTGQQIGNTFDNSAGVNSVAFSPDGRSFATGGAGAQVWNLGTGQQIGATVDGVTTVNSVAFGHDGKTLTTASGIAVGRSNSGAQVWDLGTGQQIGATIDGSTGANSAAFSPDGKTLAVASDAGVRLWDLKTGQQVGTTLGGSGVDAVAFSSDDTTLATGGDAGAQLWNLKTGQQIGDTFDGASSVSSVAFSPDGRTLAIGIDNQGSSVGGTQLWNVRTGHQIGNTLDGPTAVGSVAFSPDGKTLATANTVGIGGGAELWNVSTGRQIGKPLDSPSMISSVAFSPDGKTLATSNIDLGGGGVRLWNIGTGRQIGTTFDSLDVVNSVTFSPDGKTLATTVAHGTSDGNISGGGVQLWDIGTGKQVGNAFDGSSFVNSVAFSPDGRTIATSVHGTQLWDVGYLVDFQRQLCDEVGGSLTRGFWARYVPPGPAYRSICS